MSKNDAIVLKANFEDWKKRTEGLQDIDPWLYFCVEQVVKQFMLDDEEIQYGLTDGGNDGGADAIFIVANQGQLIQEDSEFQGKDVSRIRVIFIQVKQSGGFKPTEIEKFIQLTDDFFDLSKEATSFGERYNAEVVKQMKIWREKYLKVLGGFPEIMIDYYYITGHDVVPNNIAKDSAERVKEKGSHLTKGKCRFLFLGASEMWDHVQRRPPQTRDIKWSEVPITTPEGMVGLVKLKDFFEFLKEEDGVLAEHIFESNVRGYQKSVSVNKQIQASLESTASEPNFWLLNNGVTIIASKVAAAGYHQCSVQDPQIVNGLQTSREIFNHFVKKPGENDQRSVLVKIIETKDPAIQDQIIRATNSQNRLLPASLRMTDQIHRDIEVVFKKVGLFYDRRKGFYRDQGKPIKKIISINALAQAAISVLLQRPDDARARPGNYFKEDARYETLFGDTKIPLPSYLSCVQIVDCVEKHLVEKSIERGDVKNLKFYIAALAARKLTNLKKPPAETILQIEKPSAIDKKVLEECYKLVAKWYEDLSAETERDKDTIARGSQLLKKLDAYSEETFNQKKAKGNGKDSSSG